MIMGNFKSPYYEEYKFVTELYARNKVTKLVNT